MSRILKFSVIFAIPLLILTQYLAFTGISLVLLMKSPFLLKVVSFYFLGFVLFSGLVHWGLEKRKYWALWAYEGLIVVPWGGVTVFLLLKNSSFVTAFLTIIILGYLFLSTYFLRSYFYKSFFDSGRRWYQGLPSALPGVVCEVDGTEWKVSRLDREGAYLFKTPTGPHSPARLPLNRKRQDFRFKKGALSVQIAGEYWIKKQDWNGFGVRFNIDGMDGKKELGDFIEQLKGYGYEG